VDHDKELVINVAFPRLFLMLVEVLISYLGYMLFKRRDARTALLMIRALLEGFRNLRIPLSKRTGVMRARKVKEREVNRAMNALVDVSLILPRSLRRALGLKW